MVKVKSLRPDVFGVLDEGRRNVGEGAITENLILCSIMPRLEFAPIKFCYFKFPNLKSILRITYYAIILIKQLVAAR
jgi:hypothetical protein